MNAKDEISKKRLYIEGLKLAIAMPLPEEFSRDLEEIFQDDETDEDLKKTLMLWKEVAGPFDNAIVFIHNNRFIIEEKDAIINADDETPFMMPHEIFNILMTLLKATTAEFLAVLQIPSNKKAKLLECVGQDDEEGFISVLERIDCDTTALAKLCARCIDDASTGFDMKNDDFSYYLEHIASRLKEEKRSDNGPMLEAVRQWQPSAETLENDDSDETLQRYFSDYRHFLETDLASNLHYYWDWYDEFTLKERNLIEPILEHPLAVDLVNRIRKDYEDNLIDANERSKEAAPLAHNTSETITDGDKNAKLSAEEEEVVKNFDIRKTFFSTPKGRGMKKEWKYDIPHCTITNEKFSQWSDKEKAEKLEQLIKLLARRRCIEPTDIEMKSCAYAFTGIGFRSPFNPIEVHWKPEEFKILLYICKRFFKPIKNCNFIPAVDIFHVREEYDKCYPNQSSVADEVEKDVFHSEFKKIFGGL